MPISSADERGSSLKAAILGVPASQYQIRTAAVESTYLPHISTQGVLLRRLGGLFDVTAAFAESDHVSHGGCRLVWIDCGHPPKVHAADGSVRGPPATRRKTSVSGAWQRTIVRRLIRPTTSQYVRNHLSTASRSKNFSADADKAMHAEHADNSVLNELSGHMIGKPRLEFKRVAHGL
jgi:hypothetical protein